VIAEPAEKPAHPLVDRAIGGGIDGIIAVSEPISAATTNSPNIIPGPQPTAEEHIEVEDGWSFQLVHDLRERT
jgi:hypothetical protein